MLETALEAAYSLYFTHDTLLYLDTTHTSHYQTSRMETLRGLSNTWAFSRRFKGARS